MSERVARQAAADPPPTSDWILVGEPPPMVLEVSVAGLGALFMWSPRGFAAQFGLRHARHWQSFEGEDSIDLRMCTARWLDAAGEAIPQSALSGCALVSSRGARIPLADAVGLLGCQEPEGFAVAQALGLSGGVTSLQSPSSSTRVGTADGFYSSRKGALHLPGKSRRWMLDHARGIPGARKVGRDWILSHADYVRWMAEQDAARCRTGAPTVHDADARTIAERTLANAGLRATRGN